jgi:FKBP-type peptidyl-prolyl cis-trans isomerase 2
MSLQLRVFPVIGMSVSVDGRAAPVDGRVISIAGRSVPVDVNAFHVLAELSQYMLEVTI